MQPVAPSLCAAAAHLRSPAVGLTRQQAGQLLQGCPDLFSWPPEQRATVLIGELMGAGLAAEEAAQCFIKFPEAAVVNSFAAGLAELAAILAHSQDRDSRLGGTRPKVPAPQRTAATLLQQTPSAVMLVCNAAGYLQQNAAELQQVGFTPADVAALAWDRPELLSRDAAGNMARAAAVLQQELGLTAAETVSLVARRRHSPKQPSDLAPPSRLEPPPQHVPPAQRQHIKCLFLSPASLHAISSTVSCTQNSVAGACTRGILEAGSPLAWSRSRSSPRRLQSVLGKPLQRGSACRLGLEGASAAAASARPSRPPLVRPALPRTSNRAEAIQ